ncbi:MAG: histidinol-phosphate transaminase [Dehalococcoidia bacterium]
MTDSANKTRRNVLDLVQPHILGLDAYEPVDPPEVLAQQAGIPESEIIKVNGNENPYGPSPRVVTKLGTLHRVHLYPDPRQTAMRESVSRFLAGMGQEGIGPEHIVVGNGSDEIIDLLFRALLAPDDAIVNCTPTFGMYSFSAHVCGGRTISVNRGPAFEVDVDAVLSAAATDKVKIIVIASPNNPTGNSIPMRDVERLLDSGPLVMVDEAYVEFDGTSVAPLLARHPNLVVLRTLSKWAGLAGMRVGYGIMAPELADVLMKAKPPYNVSQASEAALLVSLEDADDLLGKVRLIVQERERTRELLGKLPGVTPWPSDANFLLCRVPDGQGRAVYEGMARRGVFVRYYGSQALRDFVRVSIGTPEQTERIVRAFAESLDDA